MKNWMKTLPVMMALTVSFAAHAQVDPTLDAELGEGKIAAAQAQGQSNSQIDILKGAIDAQMAKIHALTNQINAQVTNTTTPDGEATPEAIKARDALKLDADASLQVEELRKSKSTSITDFQLMQSSLLATTIELQNMAQ